MPTLANLSANFLQYYITSRRLKSAFQFFDTELTFLLQLTELAPKLLPNGSEQSGIETIVLSLKEMKNEKSTILSLLDTQLERLDRLTEVPFRGNKNLICAKQAYLESHSLDWLNKYHSIKTQLFMIIANAKQNGT